MADPFSILATVVTVVEVANVVTKRLSVVCQSTRSLSSSLEETLESTQLLALNNQDAMTARTDLAANLAFMLPFSRTVARCDSLLAQINAEVDRLLSVPNWGTNTYGKIMFRAKLFFAERRLCEHQESLHQLRDDLGFCMIAVQSYATLRCQHAQVGVSVVVPRIKDFSANFDFGSIHASNAMMCFAAFIRDLDTVGCQPVYTGRVDTATAVVERTLIDIRAALLTHLDYFRPLALHLDQFANSSKPAHTNGHTMFRLGAGKVVQLQQESGGQFVQGSTLHPPHRAFPLLDGHFHKAYRILIDARINAKPFETLLDALILHYIRGWSERFWEIVHDRFYKGDSFELSLEEKLQIVLWFWGHGVRTDCGWRCSWKVQVTILHTGPCFQSPWKADLHAFVSLLERIPLYAFQFTYFCMRMHGDEGFETFRILESHQHAFAIIPPLDPGMITGYHLLDFRAFSDPTTLQGPIGCWFPTCEPSLDVSQIDADTIDPCDSWMGKHCTGYFHQTEISHSMIWQLMAFRMKPVERYARPPFVSCCREQTPGTDLNKLRSMGLVPAARKIFKWEFDRSISRLGFTKWANCQSMNSLTWLAYDMVESLDPRGQR